MAIRAYLGFDTGSKSSAVPIHGEVTENNYTGWIELTSFTFGLENSTIIRTRSGGAGAGKTEFKELVVTKALDMTTPALVQTLCIGAQYDTVSLDIVQDTGSKDKPSKPMAQFQMKLVMIADIEFSAAAGDDLVEEVMTIRFGALKVTSYPRSETGDAQPQEATWSNVLNKNTFEVT